MYLTFASAKDLLILYYFGGWLIVTLAFASTLPAPQSVNIKSHFLTESVLLGLIVKFISSISILDWYHAFDFLQCF